MNSVAHDEYFDRKFPPESQRRPRIDIFSRHVVDLFWIGAVVTIALLACMILVIFWPLQAELPWKDRLQIIGVAFSLALGAYYKLYELGTKRLSLADILATEIYTILLIYHRIQLFLMLDAIKISLKETSVGSLKPVGSETYAVAFDANIEDFGFLSQAAARHVAGFQLFFKLSRDLCKQFANWSEEQPVLEQRNDLQRAQWSVAKSVQQAVRALCNLYEPDDESFTALAALSELFVIAEERLKEGTPEPYPGAWGHSVQ